MAKLSDAELSRLFDLLPNDVDRDPWSNICLAIKNDLGDVGFRFFDQWSKRHESYDERETRRVYKTARPRGDISGATIVRMAQQAGIWQQVKGDGYPLTEDGLALAFKDRYRDALRFDHSIGAWFEWRGTHWKRDETRRAFNFARETVRELSGASNDPAKAARPVAKAATAAAVERFAQADPDLAVSGEAWDNDPLLLGTPGGTVDLRTGELRRSVPWEGITKITGVAPSERGECPHWLRFLDETTGGDGELVEYLQRVVGYALTGQTSEHAAFFVYGNGGNGKSVFLDIVAHVLGDYSRTSPIDALTASKHDRHPTELAALKGARLVTASETQEGRAWDEAKLKQLTGGDKIAARYMRQDFFEFKPEFKLLIAGNHQPNLRHVDEAMKRRINMLPFARKPRVVDPDLPKKLKAEGAGILRWAVEGCLAWQAQGLSRPAIVEAATADYFAAQDVFGDWLDTNCRVEPENNYLWTSSAELYEDWKNFAVSAGEEPGKQTGIAARLAKRGIRPHRKKSGRGFSGIALEANAFEEAAKDDAAAPKRTKF